MKSDKTYTLAISELPSVDAAGKIPESYLYFPMSRTEILEYGSRSELPAQGERGNIYVIQVAGESLIWTGKEYTPLVSSDSWHKPLSGIHYKPTNCKNCAAPVKNLSQIACLYCGSVLSGAPDSF